ADVVSVLDASGFEIIIIETVGAGQLEVDVARIAQTVIVVEAPGAGDEVQAVKAGILEIADIIVVNKADRDGVGQTVQALQSALDLTPLPGHGHHGHQAATLKETVGWRPPILKVSALNHEGIDELLASVRQHGEYLTASGEGERRFQLRIEADILARLREMLLAQALGRIARADYQELLLAAGRRTLHPGEAARRLLDTLPS
ncbi:MAG TPA: methylmalonyl Co-A mutase-associated GTPase MeaB, partial [Anaerolineae bacterium]